MTKLLLLFNTIKFLKPIQIKYRAFYFLRKKVRRFYFFDYSFKKKSNAQNLIFMNSIKNYQSYFLDNHFQFVNLDKKFHKIDWNYIEYGKLWTYNLNYFEYLNQNKMSTEVGLELIENYIKNIENINSGNEAFPTSLRLINWIKFLVLHKINNQEINDSLYAQSYILIDNLEYHLLGNHLLENAFGLLFATYYFEDEKLYSISKRILIEELEEQILKDGGHFELSPMYHQLMLCRILDCINLIQNNKWKNQELLELLSNKAELMLGWLDNMTYINGSIPLLNDSAMGIAPTTLELFEYAKRLSIEMKSCKLLESGYRKFKSTNYEIVIDVGAIGPDYIPGHAHSDTFNFELQLYGKPFIVDTGLSTYENNAQRMSERSTKAHNTVQIAKKEQSQVWGGFRVANRANITDIKESINSIEATHDGYKKEKINHTRKWTYLEDIIIIEDNMNKEVEAIARFHFHPEVSKEEILETIVFKSNDYTISTYQFAPKFNVNIEALVLEVKFLKTLRVEIIVNKTI